MKTNFVVKQLLNSAVAKYRDLSVCRSSIICRSRRLRRIIDLQVIDKARYFAQPLPITDNFLLLQLSMVNYYMEARRMGSSSIHENCFPL